MMLVASYHPQHFLHVILCGVAFIVLSPWCDKCLRSNNPSLVGNIKCVILVLYHMMPYPNPTLRNAIVNFISTRLRFCATPNCTNKLG